MDESSTIGRIMRQALEPRAPAPKARPMSDSEYGRYARSSVERQEKIGALIGENKRAAISEARKLQGRDRNEPSMYRATKDRGRRLRKLRRGEAAYRRSLDSRR